MSNSDSILLSPDRDIVPNCDPLADHDFSDESCIGGDPGVLHNRHTVVKWHDLTMSRGIVEIRNVVGKVATNAINF